MRTYIGIYQPTFINYSVRYVDYGIIYMYKGIVRGGFFLNNTLLEYMNKKKFNILRVYWVYRLYALKYVWKVLTYYIN